MSHGREHRTDIVHHGAVFHRYRGVAHSFDDSRRLAPLVHGVFLLVTYGIVMDDTVLHRQLRLLQRRTVLEVVIATDEDGGTAHRRPTVGDDAVAHDIPRHALGTVGTRTGTDEDTTTIAVRLAIAVGALRVGVVVLGIVRLLGITVGDIESVEDSIMHIREDDTVHTVIFILADDVAVDARDILLRVTGDNGLTGGILRIGDSRACQT